MATITIRNLPDEVRDKLRIRAAERGQSMEAEARLILSDTLMEQERRAHRVKAWGDFQAYVQEHMKNGPGDSVDAFLRDRKRDHIVEVLKDGDDPKDVFGSRLNTALQDAGLSETDLDELRERVRSGRR